MQGINAALKFYQDFGQQMILSRFPEYESRIAVGLVGHGSECFGYDDSISVDHDYAPGFLMWLTDEDYVKIGSALESSYCELPDSVPAEESRAGGNIRRVYRIGEFFSRYTGSENYPMEWNQWLMLPSWALAEATNGKVFTDDLGEYSKFRNYLLDGIPEDVRLKKLSGRIFTMAQAGQYNYRRCLLHGESGAAMLAISEFVNAASGAVFLLNRRHMPYYKWTLRALKELPVLGNISEALEFLLTGDNEPETQEQSRMLLRISVST